MKTKRLSRSFFLQHTVEVAKALVGKTLQVGTKQGRIIETEAYRGKDDLASHASRGETPRTKLMFGAPGMAYVYLVYGMHYCLNVVTEKTGIPGAVLIRGVECLNEEKKVINGPGRVSKYFKIDLTYNGQDMMQSETFCFFNNTQKITYVPTPRIGITKAQDKLWRFKEA